MTAAALDRFNDRCPASMGGVADFPAELRHDLSRQAAGLPAKNEDIVFLKCRRIGADLSLVVIANKRRPASASLQAAQSG